MSDDLSVIGDAYLIALSNANNAQRDAVQAIVKAHTRSWWHERPDLWLVEGHNAAYWRDLIKPVLGLSAATVTVFGLPAAGREWAASSLPPQQARWLYESYTGEHQPTPQTALPKPDDDITF